MEVCKICIKKLSSAQKKKMRLGKKVRIMKGEGMNLIIKPYKFSLINRNFNRDKAILVELDEEELKSNSMEGGALFSKVKNTVDKIKKGYEKYVPEQIKGEIKDTYNKYKDEGIKDLKTIVNKYKKEGIKDLKSTAKTLGKTATTALATTAMTEAPTLTPYILKGKQMADKFIEEQVGSGVGLPKRYNNGGGLYASSNGRGITDLSNRQLPPALRSQYDANFFVKNQHYNNIQGMGLDGTELNYNKSLHPALRSQYDANFFFKNQLYNNIQGKGLYI